MNYEEEIWFSLGKNLQIILKNSVNTKLVRSAKGLREIETQKFVNRNKY